MYGKIRESRLLNIEVYENEDLLYKVLDEKVEEEKINVYFFYGDGCPHCAKEEEFLEEVKKDVEEAVSKHRGETDEDTDIK